MNDTLKTLMVEQLEKCWFSDERIHLNAIFHYQEREGNLGLVFEILGNREAFHSVVLWASLGKLGNHLNLNRCSHCCDLINSCRSLSHDHCLDAGAQLSLPVRSPCLSAALFIA